MTITKILAKSTITYPETDTQRPDKEITRTDCQGGVKHGLDTFTLNTYETSAYNELHSVSQIGFIRSAPVYKLIPANFRVLTSGAGTVTVMGDHANEYACTSGTSTGDYGALQSFRSINAEAGRGLGVRFGARFPSNSSTTWQGVGLLAIGDEVSFGYSGTSFGIWHRYGGVAEVRTLTITVPAGGAETATVTVNSTAYNISITAGTTAHNAKEIADYLHTNATGYTAYQLAATVIVVAKTDGEKSDTWSFSSTGVATASFARTTTGITKTSDFVSQSDWNGDSIATLDPTKGNIYEIQVQAGYGDIYYRIQDTTSKRFINVHTVKWSNSNSKTNLRNPSLRTGMYSTAIGTTTSITNYCSFFDAFLENGPDRQTRNPRSTFNTKSISTTSTSIFSIRNKAVYNGYTNQAEIVPIFLDIANEGNKSAVINILTGATVGGEENWQNTGTNLISELDTAGTTVTGGTLLGSFVVAPGDTALIDLRNLAVRLPPTLKLTVGCNLITGGSPADITASLSWVEEI